ncbi:MAG TPA: KEOPS complex subunit Cgi121 [Methanomassiliicoccales archaeon]|nr:KEOPS complex subunit Cgi121 [Methanomassiliicoccales archaeon]
MAEFEIVGARGTIQDPRELVRRLQSLKEGQALALNADLVCGTEHIEIAVCHALRSFRRGTNSCNTIMMETLLFASGERQISKAQEKMSPSQGEAHVAFVLFGASAEEALRTSQLERDDSVLACSDEKARRFGIGEKELETVGDGKAQDLVLERVAFVEIAKR